MKPLNLILAAALTLLALTTNVEARVNPAVQPIFFEHLQNVLPSSEPAAVGRDGTVTEVTLEGLAWAVNNVKNDHVPLVIEFYSSNQSTCAVNAQSGDNEVSAKPESPLPQPPLTRTGSGFCAST